MPLAGEAEVGLTSKDPTAGSQYERGIEPSTPMFQKNWEN